MGEMRQMTADFMVVTYYVTNDRTTVGHISVSYHHVVRANHLRTFGP